MRTYTLLGGIVLLTIGVWIGSLWGPSYCAAATTPQQGITSCIAVTAGSIQIERISYDAGFFRHPGFNWDPSAGAVTWTGILYVAITPTSWQTRISIPLWVPLLCCLVIFVVVRLSRNLGGYLGFGKARLLTLQSCVAVVTILGIAHINSFGASRQSVESYLYGHLLGVDNGRVYWRTASATACLPSVSTMVTFPIVAIELVCILIGSVPAMLYSLDRRRLSVRLCTTCGYSLHGLPEQRCPECGTPFERKEKPERADMGARRADKA